MPLNRDEVPKSTWEHNYQLGFFVAETKRFGSIILWRSVSRRKFLRRYYDFVAQLSDPEDCLALFHTGDVQRFGRTVFRALRV